mgnify:CR=1 FL=1
MFNHNGLNHGYTRLNIFTETEQVEFIPVSLCHCQFIKYRRCCLSLARLNDYENNNSARVPWTKMESANILFNMRRQGKCALY